MGGGLQGKIKRKSGFEEESGEGEAEVKEERGRRVKEGGREAMGGVEGCGKRGGGGAGTTKGDSCDANPIHPLAYIHTHVQALPIICSLSSCFSSSSSHFPVLLSAILIGCWFSGDRRPITVIRP